MKKIILTICLCLIFISVPIGAYSLGIDSDTQLMLYCDVTDGSTSFPDESDFDHTLTAVATAEV